jgi:hypothetical protein
MSSLIVWTHLLIFTEDVKFGMEAAENDSWDLANLGVKLTGLDNGRKKLLNVGATFSSNK